MAARLRLFLIFGALLTAFSAAEAAPRFEPAACPEVSEADVCGYVTVPEQRSKPGKTIKVFVMKVHSKFGTQGKEPVFFLTGGPGERSTYYPGLAPLFPDRDFITFDQRGVGLSQPALNCTQEQNAEQDDLFSDSLGMNPKVAAKAVSALVKCGKRLRSQGVALEAYNATESAADVDAIRQALGYKRINLFGVSYGTRLAQEVMRAFPGSLRAAVLDSVIPPAIDRALETPVAIDESLRRVFAACDRDAECKRSYPNLAHAYQDVLNRLQAEPVSLPQGERELELDAGGFQALVMVSLYNPAAIAQLPELISDLYTGHYEVLKQGEGVKTAETIAENLTFGAFITHECRGEVAYSPPGGLDKVYARLPEWRLSIGIGPGIASDQIREVCTAWGLNSPSGRENQPLSSDVPALLLAGEFDPVTPPRFLPQAMAGLRHAWSFTLPGLAHAVSLTSPCGYLMVRDFLANPGQKPDSACLAGLKPQFRQW